MIKQIEIYGQRVKLYSPDKGRTWSSSSQHMNSAARHLGPLAAPL
jgi:hypothetical protein